MYIFLCFISIMDIHILRAGECRAHMIDNCLTFSRRNPNPKLNANPKTNLKGERHRNACAVVEPDCYCRTQCRPWAFNLTEPYVTYTCP